MISYGIGSEDHQASLSKDSAGLSQVVYVRRVVYSVFDPEPLD
jgi:hypothetical protein